MDQRIGVVKSIERQAQELKEWESKQQCFSNFLSHILLVKHLPTNVYGALSIWQSKGLEGDQFACFENSGLRAITWRFFQTLARLKDTTN